MGLLDGISNALFGGRKSAAEPYRRQAEATLNGMQPMRNTYYGMGQQAQNRYQSASPQYQDSVNQLGGMLRARMGFQGRTQAAQRLMGNATNAYNAARSRMMSGMGGRGMDGFTAGMLSNVEGQYAGNVANAINNADAQNFDYAKALEDLYRNQADRAQSDMYRAYGAANDLDQYRISALSQFGQAAEQEAAAREANAMNQMMGLIGAGSNIYGGWLAGRRKPQPAPLVVGPAQQMTAPPMQTRNSYYTG